MFTLLKQEGAARRGRFVTPHGVIETPVFMNVGTSAAIKGAVGTDDLKQIKCQVKLSNTYHLHVRPGDDVIVPPAGSCGTAKDRMENQTDEQYCLDWFLCFRKSK